MDLDTAKAVANLLITLGNVNFEQVREAVRPFHKILQQFESKGQEIVFGELVWDDEWIFESEIGDGPDGCTLSHPAEGAEDLNPKHTYDAIGLYMSDASRDFVQVLAVGEVLTFEEDAPTPPDEPIDVDAVLHHGLAMAADIVKTHYEDGNFGDRILDYVRKGRDREQLHGIHPRPSEWGRFDANAEKWAKTADQEAWRWLVMHSEGHPYPHAVQLRVRTGYMKLENA